MRASELSLFLLLGLGCSSLPPEEIAPAPISISQPAAKAPPSLVPFCGNGTRDLISGDSRSLDKVEECDSPTRGCNLQYCVFSQCGDGVLDPGESCDDHNSLSGDGCSIRCEIELNTPDNSIEAADAHHRTISKESVLVGSLQDGAPNEREVDFLSFTLSFPAELVILDHGFYDCGLSRTTATLLDRQQKILWTEQGFPATRKVVVQPGSYYLKLDFEMQEYTLWFRELAAQPTHTLAQQTKSLQ